MDETPSFGRFIPVEYGKAKAHPSMPQPPAPWIRAALVAATLASGGPAAAQLIGGPGVGGAIGGATAALPGRPLGGELQRLPRTRAPDLARDLSDTVGQTSAGLVDDLRRLTVERLIREHPDVVDVDERGAPVRRGAVLALFPTPEGLSAAQRAGFGVESRISAPELGLEGVVLTAPAGVSTREAVRRLRAADPQGQYEFDHLYQEGGVLGGLAAAGPSAGVRGVRVGLVDGSVAAGHPALRGVKLTQRAFGPGGAKVSAHATAAASLLAGSDRSFRSAAPGAQVLVADVYGPTPAGGSAAAIASGFAWLVQNKVGVISVSLVGPPNLLLAAAVRGLTAKGALVVAAVGNDGPAAPPLYPAAYPGVVAVTAVDARRRPLPEAGRGRHVAFAAPGAQMAAAASAGGFTTVRGTSFATPIVAGLLARDLPAPDAAGASAAVRRLAAGAQDLGSRGRDSTYGYGLVGFDLRTEPSRVAASATPLRGP